MSETEIVETSQPLARVEPRSEVEALIRVALEKSINPTELYAILTAERAQRAEQAFNVAFAAFKAECPPIRRRSENAQFMVTRNGVRQPSRYAALEDIDADTRQSLTGNGLSYAWGDALVSGDTITMTCIVSHVGGHKRSSSVTMPIGKTIVSREGKEVQSPLQVSGVTITYLRRYSLINALGLTTCDDDGDGDDPGHSIGGDTITEAQAAKLLALITETKSDWDKFLVYANVSALSEIKQSRYAWLLSALERKKGKP